jgi:hypothetical protein
MTPHEFLARMLEATPEPPDPTDVDGLLVAFALMSHERQLLIDQLPEGVADPAFEIAEALEARQRAWREALAAAQVLVKAQRLGTSKLRGYATEAPPLDDFTTVG